MNWFENHKREYRTVLATIAAILTFYLNEQVEQSFPNGHNLKYILVIVLVVITTTLFNNLLDKLIDKSVGLRRILLGSNFIEGYYYDLSVDIEKYIVRHGVLFNVEYEDGGFKANGVTYDRKGNRKATWKSISCTYQDRVLYIQYESHTDYSNTGIEMGLLQLQFEKPANSYSGFYFDMANQKKYNITGCRVTKEELKNFGLFKNTDHKKQFILKKIEEESEFLKNQ